MYWAKRQFEYAAYAPYQDKLQQLMMTMPQRFAEFIMVSTDTEEPGTSTYYIGAPEKALLSAFDGFEAINESQLPKEIDSVELADQTKEPFTSRFRFKKR